MAVRTRWTVQHPCSHAVEHDLSGRPADKRAGFARWLATKNCTDCWKAARDTDSPSKEEWLAAKRAQEQQAAVEWAEKFDMPPMEGPDKALDWGVRSRHQLVAAAHNRAGGRGDLGRGGLGGGGGEGAGHHAGRMVDRPAGRRGL
ncbi:hypothetical protein M2266_005961 [Streptomyces sp. SPB162]|nr:hypothetical protein [Streptomyces sp. SPB162]